MLSLENKNNKSSASATLLSKKLTIYSYLIKPIYLNCVDLFK